MALSDPFKKFMNERQASDSQENHWVDWFTGEKAKAVDLHLYHAGVETYQTQILDAKVVTQASEADESTFHPELTLVTDRLLPTPEPDFWKESASLEGKLIFIEDGVEVTTTFKAKPAGIMEDGEGELTELSPITDIQVASKEFIAELTPKFGVELGLVWFGEWRNFHPQRMTISRFIFEADLEDLIGPDGYAVPKASVKLEPGGPEIPVRLQLFKRKHELYEAKLEKIDPIAHQKLTSIIEEIWMIGAGLSQRKMDKPEESEVSYMTREHDALAEAFQPHIVYLGSDKEWIERLEELGVVNILTTPDLDEIPPLCVEKRCDLVVAESELWGQDAIQVERLLRATSKTRDIPRVWIEADFRKQDQLPEILDYGAFHTVPRNEKKAVSHEWMRWAFGGEVYGWGEPIALFTKDKRLRFRLPIILATAKYRIAVMDHPEGFLPFLTDYRPSYVMFDIESFGEDARVILNTLLRWSMQADIKIINLVRGAPPELIYTWLQQGVSDIVIKDASLNEAAMRILARMQGGLE